ncbi:TauD/TfdA family dioxygenase [Pseudomonas sp. RIT-PI-AD]|uniref:TauD/TfdA family dioxygenase n=1 Tax=Pseudomonas sp. RIT-PI-AD TaxID=3035294 RepID=UPI0021DA38BC|nr:TauD/TfdA family dioxygenase [Pseudomonas sp. RIT-PI-AD]
MERPSFNLAERGFKRPQGLKPRGSEALVKRWHAETDQLPTRIEAQVPGLSLAEWIAEQRDALHEALRCSGGLLFRGFEVAAAEGFRAAAHAFAPDLLNYKERSSPRNQVSGEVYTSTEHPVDQPIFLHNEQSYTVDWPQFIMFYCETPAAVGGATPIAANRRIVRHLPASLLERFDRLGILYVRNYVSGLGLSWREAFQTDRREEVEAFCAEHSIAHAWLGDDHLRTWQRRAAFQRHPHSGERLWFNHGTFFHATSLEPGLRDALLSSVSPEDLPYQTYYGDGSPLEVEALELIRAAIDRETQRFDWKAGDVLILDNMLAQHGRDPFSGQRRVLTIMSTPYSIHAQADIPDTPPTLVLEASR